ncbi:MAG: uracil-DNA glycosylase [Zetaproteobacteria bacterium CG_4_9_14_3_um_filter_53_7]|nr:MAG: uracil-DNA glycosylase [Zetaproteobacteria bacterium CG_4_9_14_3_um_filter_53_7]
MTVADNNTPKRAPCMSCRHYFITWDHHRPHGCRAFQFKSALLPCYDVQGASQITCLKYEAKPVKK